MTPVIVLFPKEEVAKNIRNLLVRNGVPVKAVCTTGAAALNNSQEYNDGIVICGYRYVDMVYSELKADLPPGFEMLLVVSRERWEEVCGENIVCVQLPLKVHELLSTVNMMTENIERRKRRRKEMPKKRSRDEEELVNKAKALLMDRNNLSENEAHKYLQKTSMDSGTNIVETAQMILSLMG